jgi:hypothetical protein
MLCAPIICYFQKKDRSFCKTTQDTHIYNSCIMTEICPIVTAPYFFSFSVKYVTQRANRCEFDFFKNAFPRAGGLYALQPILSYD